MGTSHKDRYTFLNISPLVLLRTRNIWNTSSRENQNTLFFFKSCLLWDNVEKYCRTRGATDDSMAHAHFMLDT